MNYGSKTDLETISMRRLMAAVLCAGFLSAHPTALAESDRVTFNRDVAPIFFNHCVMCHRPNEVAPMSLLTYKEARPWAKSIAQQVVAENMPPFSGESDNHQWSNDISLSDEQKETIVKWVEQGAAQGAPNDLPDAPTFTPGWTLGEPDYVITLDKIEVYADGEDLFPNMSSTIDIDEPRWIKAIEFKPGDRRVTHHFVSTYGRQSGILAVWTAGMPPYVFPEGIGRVVNPGDRVTVNAHYHPFGEATKDTTKIGLYFGEGELKKQVSTLIVANTGLRIPPGSPNHSELAFHYFDQDTQILALSPHMHVRGRSMRYDITYPDGTQENLLDVPKYDYNWQWLYYPTKPIDVPAGSRIDITATWNNSSDNPSNPDPTQEIIYRGNTFNEMFVGFLEIIPAEGVAYEPVSPVDAITGLLQKHPTEDTFLVGGMIPFGIYAPREGEGWIYMSQGGASFTTTIDDFEWDGDRLAIRTSFPTPDASATATIIEAELNEQGELVGTLLYGTDRERPLTIPVIGRHIDPIQTALSTQTDD